MADQKLSSRTTTIITEGGFIHIIIPDGAAPSGYVSRKIAVDNLDDALNTYKDRDANQSANFTKSMDANTMLESIDLYHVSGSPVIKVGTSLGTNDIISGRTLSSSIDSANLLHKPLTGATTLYFTITGGTADIITTYKKNYNA